MNSTAAAAQTITLQQKESLHSLTRLLSFLYTVYAVESSSVVTHNVCYCRLTLLTCLNHSLKVILRGVPEPRDVLHNLLQLHFSARSVSMHNTTTPVHSNFLSHLAPQIKKIKKFLSGCRSQDPPSACYHLATPSMHLLLTYLRCVWFGSLGALAGWCIKSVISQWPSFPR